MDFKLTTLISIVTALIGAFVGYAGFLRTRKKDQTDEGTVRGAMASDIGYIKAGVDDLKRESRETRQEVAGLTERVTRCEESCKQAHKRIDELHKERMNNFEN